jgi:hypothetical protein
VSAPGTLADGAGVDYKKLARTHLIGELTQGDCSLIGAWGGAIGPNQSIQDAYYGAGYDDNYVSRLDTRHELSIPLSSDWITVTPFATGEATGYLMDEFAQYTADVDNLLDAAGYQAVADAS